MPGFGPGTIKPQTNTSALPPYENQTGSNNDKPSPSLVTKHLEGDNLIS